MFKFFSSTLSIISETKYNDEVLKRIQAYKKNLNKKYQPVLYFTPKNRILKLFGCLLRRILEQGKNEFSLDEMDDFSFNLLKEIITKTNNNDFLLISSVNP